MYCDNELQLTALQRSRTPQAAHNALHEDKLQQQQAGQFTLVGGLFAYGDC